MASALSALDVEDLQRRGRTGDESAILELGRRVLDIDFCLADSGKRYCRHEHDFNELLNKLDIEIPPQCPHCNGWLTDH